jgi:hypothetical protein
MNRSEPISLPLNRFVMKDSFGLLMALVFGALLLAPRDCAAQPFVLQNGAINGGSSIAHGGPYSVASSSGQTTSGQSAGGQFGVQGGEATGTSPFTGPIIPTMVVVNSGPANVLVGWVPLVQGYVLEFADTLRSPRWFPYPSATGTNQHTIPVGARQLFFRLKKVSPPAQ